MGIKCYNCSAVFPSNGALQNHYRSQHRHPRPKFRSTFAYHPHLTGKFSLSYYQKDHSNLHTGQPCDRDGNFLEPGAESPLLLNTDTTDWSPFASKPAFEFAEENFEQAQSSATHVNAMLRIMAEHQKIHGLNEPIYADYNDMLAHIDAISLGDAPFKEFRLRPRGKITDRSPSWMRKTYSFYARNTRTVVHNMLANTQFDGHINYRPYIEYDASGKRIWSNLMSGDWAFKQAVRDRYGQSSESGNSPPLSCRIKSPKIHLRMAP
jgi:hypothetical protein